MRGGKHAKCVSAENRTKLTSTCAGLQESRVHDFTLETWVPRPLCRPEHPIQINTPKFVDAHRGPIEWFVEEEEEEIKSVHRWMEDGRVSPR